MAKLEKIIAVLPSYNVLKSKDFYQTKLGFNLVGEFGDPVHLLIVKRDEIVIHLFQCDKKEIAEWTSCRVQVSGINDLYKKYKDRRVIHPKGKLETKPWGLKEFTVLDDSGVGITFFEG